MEQKQNTLDLVDDIKHKITDNDYKLIAESIAAIPDNNKLPKELFNLLHETKYYFDLVNNDELLEMEDFVRLLITKIADKFDKINKIIQDHQN